MGRRKLLNKLIDRGDIHEELRKIKDSDSDYVTPTGKVYTDYGNNKFYKKKITVNKSNGYIYIMIHKGFNKAGQKRLHRCVAEAYIPNPNNYPIVMHLDNDKTNNCVENLKWGTISENTKQAFDDGLIKNDKGFNDSQSKPICVFDFNTHKLIDVCGSISLASKKYKIEKIIISSQAHHYVKNPNKLRKYKIYFRFLSEYLNKGFVL